MTKDQAVTHFGTQQKLADALGMLQGSVAGWKDHPPPLRQLQIEALTGGALKAEPECDKFRVQPAATEPDPQPAGVAP